MDPVKKNIAILSIIKFLQDELTESTLSEEKKESVEVAVQCLEMAYDVGNFRDELGGSTINLLSCIPDLSATATCITDKDRTEAEQYKNMGNSSMKNAEYGEALVAYTKAIQLNPTNAVYFCNRAAVLSKLEKHLEAIKDCKEAIQLDPTYGKAYGRLGIAYSNLSMFGDAHNAYRLALQYDPTNEMYANNLKLAEEKLKTPTGQTAQASGSPFDNMTQMISNPALINIATQMLNDPGFRNIMSGMMNMGPGDNPNLEALFQAGQTLANRMNEADPSFADNLRRNLTQINPESNNLDPINQHLNNPSNDSQGDEKNPES